MPFFEMLPGGMPAGLQSDMDAVLNKKLGTSTSYPPEDWPENVNLMGMLEEKTVSGSVVTFSDGADDVPLKSCTVTIAPTLDGVSSVEVVQMGGNFIELYTRDSNAGVSYSINNDGSLHREGTASGNSFNNGNVSDYASCPYKFKAGTYTLSVNGNIDNNTYVQLGIKTASGASVQAQGIAGNGTKTFTVNEDFGAWYYCKLNSGITVDDDVYIWINAGDTSLPYDKKIEPTTHTAQLGRTIYGGEVDVVNGTGTDENALVPFSDCTWAVVTSYQSNFNADNGIVSLRFGKNAMSAAGYAQTIDGVACNVFDNNNRSVWNNTSRVNEIGYSDGISVNLHYSDIGLSEWTSNSADTLAAWRTSQLYLTGVFSLVKATPETFTFTPVPIISRLGDNTLWGDGDLSVVYRSSGTQTLIPPTLISKTITANGTYSASDEDADGYDEVTVNVPTGTTEPFKVLSINGTAGTETFTADHAGTYMFLVGTSAQGTASITSAVTPDLTFSKQSSDNRGLIGAVYTLAIGDTVTMSNTVVSWVYNTKVVVEMNISVSAVIDSTIVNDGTITSFSPSVTGNALFISMAGGRSADNSYDRTYTNLNDFEFFGKVETGIFLRIRYGSTVPSYQLYGFDGGCALAIVLQ